MGQDIQFSQFYSAALYQNPAFAGASHYHRGSFHQRLQWPGLDAKYITSLLSFDTYSSKYRSGFGLIAFKDWQGANSLTSTDVGVQYAYEIYLSRKLSFRPGLQISYVSRNLNYGLTLPEDFTNNGYVGGSSVQLDNRVQYADISSGGILFTNAFWFGFSMHHMNRPDQSFVKGTSRLPAKVAFTGGYRISFNQTRSRHLTYLDPNKDYSITPTFHYKFQGESDQLDLGLYGIYDFLVAGIWYRGIPVKKYKKDFTNNESVVALIGWKYEQITITYSYDFTLSRLIRARTSGSHELNVTYIYKKRKSPKIRKRLPCPTFYRN